MYQEITLPFCSTLKMVASHNNWVDFYTNDDDESPFAYWDLGRTRLGVYVSSHKVFDVVKTLDDVVRCMGVLNEE
jgi:hypothetical protein